MNTKGIFELADQVANVIRNNYAELPGPVREQMEIASAQLMAAGRVLGRGGKAEPSDDPYTVHRAVRQGQGHSLSQLIRKSEDNKVEVKDNIESIWWE